MEAMHPWGNRGRGNDAGVRASPHRDRPKAAGGGGPLELRLDQDSEDRGGTWDVQTEEEQEPGQRDAGQALCCPLFLLYLHLENSLPA